jgi:hypothetical protein
MHVSDAFPIQNDMKERAASEYVLGHAKEKSEWQ